jgi:hypothetical protein
MSRKSTCRRKFFARQLSICQAAFDAVCKMVNYLLPDKLLYKKLNSAEQMKNFFLFKQLLLRMNENGCMRLTVSKCVHKRNLVFLYMGGT